MEVTEYIVPEHCFPRFQYSKKIRNALAKRYNNLMKNCKCDGEALEDRCDLNESEICIFFCKDLTSETNFPRIHSVVSRKSELIKSTPTHESFLDLLLKGSSRRNTFFITNSKCDILKSIKELKTHVIIIANDEKDEQSLLDTFKHQNVVNVCTEENICDVVSTHLERNAFTGLKNACECLDSILLKRTQHHDKSLVAKETAVKEEDSMSEDAIKRTQSLKNSKTITPIILKRSQSEISGRHNPVEKDLYDIGSSFFVKDNKQNTPFSRDRSKTVRKKGKAFNDVHQRSMAVLSKENIESLKRLYDEIVGLFNRSKLPKTEFPFLRYNMNIKVDVTLLNKLQEMGDEIQSCGYRFNTFQIYTKDGLCSDGLSTNIKALLKEYDITEYSIVSSDINQFSTCHVGKKIAVKDTLGRNVSGTLGGYAHTSSGDSARHWALISRHVAKFSSDRNLYVENGQKRAVAKIMKQIHGDEKDKQYLDIAAACLDKDEEHCHDTRYITEENVYVQGMLCDYDTDKLRGLPVHIKGASTPLGLGTITIPEQSSVQNYDLGENYIVVEDREEHGAFCKEGDSGAIVCAEHPDKYGEEVQLISMVVGENYGRKGSYTTVKLDKGLAELETLTEKTFNLS